MTSPAWANPAPGFADAQSAADLVSGGGLLVEAERDFDDGVEVIEFKYWRGAEGLVRRVDVNPVNGFVRDLDDRIPDLDDRAEFENEAAAVPAGSVSLADAVNSACALVTGDFEEVEYDFENGSLVIEVTLNDMGQLIEVDVDPATGDVLNVDGAGGGPGAPIGLNDAVLLALDNEPNADPYKVSLDDDQIPVEIDVEVLDPDAGLIREFEFDRDTGALLENELELDSGAEFALFAPLVDAANLSLLDGLAAAQDAFQSRSFDEAQYDIEDGRLVIEAEDGDFEVLVDAETGQVFIDDDGGDGGDPGINPQIPRAIASALDMFPGTAALEAEFKTGAPRARIEVELVDTTTLEVFEVALSPGSNMLLGRETEVVDADELAEIEMILDLLPDAQLSFEDALVEARRVAPNGQPREIELEIENGRLVYEVDVRGVEVYVDAIDGVAFADDFRDHIRTNGSVDLSSSDDGNGGVATTYVTDDDRLVLLELDPSTGQWFATLLDERGGLVTRPVSSATFSDDEEDRMFVSVVTPAGLVLVDPHRGASDDRNLTGEIPGSTPIVEKQTVFTSTDGLTFIAGLDAAGDLVIYFQTGEVRSDGEQIWGYANLSRDHLRAQGLDTPAFNDDLISYVTDWNGLNIAGLDAAGDIWSVWWAPGMSLWTVSNLSEITGAAPMAGGLTAYLTPWGGINLAGLDAAGEVVVTWWVPQFGADWTSNNLSRQFGHSGMGGMALTSYVTPWGGLNLAGLDDSGDLVVYWWAPGMQDWVVSPLSSLVPNAAMPTGELSASTTRDGLVNLFGFDNAGELIRYHWRPGAEWRAEEVTEHASPAP